MHARGTVCQSKIGSSLSLLLRTYAFTSADLGPRSNKYVYYRDFKCEITAVKPCGTAVNLNNLLLIGSMGIAGIGVLHDGVTIPELAHGT